MKEISSVELVESLHRLQRKLGSPDVTGNLGSMEHAADRVLLEIERRGGPRIVNEQGDLYHWAIWNDRREGRRSN